MSPATQINPADADAGVAVTPRRRGRRPIRRLLTGIAGVAALTVLGVTVVGNHAMLVHGLTAASHASPGWVLLSVAAAMLSFALAAVGVVHACRRAVAMPTTAAVELAGAFCNRITPAGLGRGLIRIRYLRRAGLSAPEVIAVTVVLAAAGGVTHGAGILIAAAATSRPPHLPAGPTASLVTGVTVGLLVMGAVTLLLVRSPRTAARRAQLGDHLRLTVAHCGRLARDPSAMVGMILGTAGSTALYLLSFLAALHAVGITMSLSTAALVYLAGTAIANAAPVPGGLGAAEIALSAGLITAGASPAPALGAVLTFRLASFWLPSIVGAFALLWLRRTGHLASAHATKQHPASRQLNAPAPIWSDPPLTTSPLTRHPVTARVPHSLSRLRNASRVLLIGGAAVVGGFIGPASAQAATATGASAQTARAVLIPTHATPIEARPIAHQRPMPSHAISNARTVRGGDDVRRDR